MNKKRILIPIAILTILIGLVIIFINRNNSSSIRKELKDFALADTASVTRIVLSTNQPKQLTLTRGKDGVWLVNDTYEARPDAIRTLIRTIHDIAVREPVSNRARANIIKQLASGSIKMEAYSNDKLVKTYFVGSETPDMLGTYMLLRDPDTKENSTHPFIVEIPGFNGYLTPRYSAELNDWRDKVVFRYFVPDIRSIRLDYAFNPELSFEVRQAGQGSGFGLFSKSGQALPFDTLAIKQYISYFNYIAHEGFATEVKKVQRDSILASKPIHTIVVTDAKGKANRIDLFLKKNTGKPPVDTTADMPPPYDPDRMYASVNDGKDFVQVQYYVFGKLLQTPEYFLANKKPSK